MYIIIVRFHRKIIIIVDFVRFLSRLTIPATDFRRIIPEGIMADMPVSLQELQRRMPGRSHQGLTTSLLSQDVAVNLLQENKTSIRRCELVWVV